MADLFSLGTHSLTLRGAVKVCTVLLIMLAFIGTVNASTTVVSLATHDGYVFRTGNFTWTSLRDGVGTSVSDSPSGVDLVAGETVEATTAYWNVSTRIIETFDLSSLPDDAIIESATISVLGTAKIDNLGKDAVKFSLIDATPASATSFVAADYNATTFTRMATDIPYATFNDDNWNTFTLNAAGLAKLSATGSVSFMLTDNNTADNVTPTWSSANQSYFKIAPRSGSYDPYITVTYRSPAHAVEPTSATANIVAALNLGGVGLIVVGISGVILTLMGVGGAGGGRTSYSTGMNTKLLIGSIMAIMLGAVLLVLAYIVISPLLNAAVG